MNHRISILCAALALSGSLAAQDAPKPARPARPAKSATAPVTLVDEGGGGPKCGLGKEFHAGRRALLAKQLETGLVLVRGLPDTRDYVAFRQDKTFWYLTGVESPDAALLMDLDTHKEMLFLPSKSAGNESWEGEKWDSEDAWVAGLSGFNDVRSGKELTAVLKELIPEGRTVWISKEPYVGLSGCADRAVPYDRQIANDPLDGRASRENKLAENLKTKFKADVKDMQKTLAQMRFVKTPEELAALEQGGRIGAMAMVEAMRSTAPGRGEWELGAVMDFVHKREGAAGPAYDAIVGSGRNSCVLHYNTNGRRMQAGEVVLIDYAPEFEHEDTDITRTWPVNGKFSERQAQIYDAVLAAQQAGIAAAKPGATIQDVNAACDKSMDDAGFGKFKRHGACHGVGLEVHDAGDYSQPLVPGCAFTIEPGLYDESSGIGVRIEDVVVITADGCKNITAGVPRERAAIEALINDKGLLDSLAEKQ
ncbi:MAG TPA: aminopeptidase P N-terminal domain-containing protein [Planctomycetota bacterium]|nr:aminopeptidase P N-terminal domain-containing protein [Planctomycetota bacterium]